MKKTTLFKTILPFCSALLLATGCAVYTDQPAGGGAEVEVAGDAPAPIAEDVEPSPGVGFVWIGGSWGWHDHWVWERGHWDRPPHAGAVWVANRSEMRHGHRVFVHGGWR
jgi:hypothetical protein